MWSVCVTKVTTRVPSGGETCMVPRDTRLWRSVHVDETMIEGQGCA